MVRKSVIGQDCICGANRASSYTKLRKIDMILNLLKKTKTLNLIHGSSSFTLVDQNPLFQNHLFDIHKSSMDEFIFIFLWQNGFDPIHSQTVLRKKFVVCTVSSKLTGKFQTFSLKWIFFSKIKRNATTKLHINIVRKYNKEN